MRRALSYAEAVRMLGGGESRLIGLLDTLAGVGGIGGGLELFDAREEAVRLGNSLTRDLGDRLRGLNRLSRTERLRAAHTVIALTAYFDALGELAPDLRLGRLGARDQLSLTGGHRAEIGRRDVARALTEVELPAPAPPRSYESMLRDLRGFYGGLSAGVAEYVAGLAVWDGLDETRRGQIEERLTGAVPDLAIERYEELFRQLAADCPEFGIWADMWERQATRAELRGGLATLARVLASTASGRLPDARRTALARSNQAALHKPITQGGEVPSGLRIPSLETGYVDHRIRVAVVDTAARPSQDSWWADVPVLADPSRFFAAYLTSPRALETPLLVLGQPGSGKSVLTRILAARLPAADFLPVRVELRQAPTESDLQARIETAILQATGERISWPRLVESSDGALPVVLLDGFDELLQATGVSQTDFLARVAAFQEREADQGRPVAVLVTSRTAVVDRARIPQNSVAVRLEPFDDGQVEEWLTAWNACNGEALRERGLRPLPARVALAHRELAEQPLLLLMLALYDADDNALLNRPADFDRTDLYERLLGEFAAREVRKHAPELAEQEQGGAVEAELLRLSIVGFAMFNRRAQWVSEADLDADLRALLGEPDGGTGLRAPLSAAQLVVGRFFFVHETQVTRDDRPLQTYEFLHATFGEFLVARLVVQVLGDMVAQEAAAARSPLTAGADDGLLHALLSFAALTARAPVIAFLGDLLGRLDDEHRRILAALLLRLHARALYARAGSAHDRYQPRPLILPGRLCSWSMNLVVLAVLVAGELTGEQLFPGADDYALAWRDEATLWRSQLIGEEWAGLLETIALRRAWDGERRDVRVWRADRTYAPEPIDIFWTYNIPPGHPDRDGAFSWIGHTPHILLRKANLTCGKSDDVMTHALQPLVEAFPAIANVFVSLTPERTVSATHALLAAVTAGPRNDAEGRHEDLAGVVGTLFSSPHGLSDEDLFMATALRVLLSAVESGAASVRCLSPLEGGLRRDTTDDPELEGLIVRLNALL